MTDNTYEIDFNIENSIPQDLKPDENIKLWRYMSFGSLCEMLIHDFIPLININKFSDKSEGAIIRSILPKLFTEKINDYKILTEKDTMDYIISKYFRHTYVSSWCKTETENAAMWDRYTQGNEGVAIKTNAKSLINSIKQYESDHKITPHEYFSDQYINSIKQKTNNPLGLFIPDIIIKEVKYEDYNPNNFKIGFNRFLNGYDRLCFYYKMKDFRDESEIRISRMINFHPSIYLLSYNNKTYLELDKEQDKHRQNSYPNDVYYLMTKSSNDLIEQIVISPYAHKAFIKTVIETKNCINSDREKAGLEKIDCDIVQSKRTNWV